MFEKGLQVKAVTVEMEDWMVSFPAYVVRSYFFSNTRLKCSRTTHHNTNINMTPTLGYGLKNICTSMTSSRV